MYNVSFPSPVYLFLPRIKCFFFLNNAAEIECKITTKF